MQVHGTGTHRSLRITDAATLEGVGTLQVTPTLAQAEWILIESGGTVSPGLSGGPGRLSIGAFAGATEGKIEFASGSTLSMTLDGLAAGTEYSQLFVRGEILLANDAVTLDLNLNYGYGASDLVFLVSYDSALAFGSTFAGLANEATINFTGPFSGTAQISYFGDVATNSFTGGNDVVLYNFSVVPEPETYALLGVFLVAMILYRNRRRA